MIKHLIANILPISNSNYVAFRRLRARWQAGRKRDKSEDIGKIKADIKLHLSILLYLVPFNYVLALISSDWALFDDFTTRKKAKR